MNNVYGFFDSKDSWKSPILKNYLYADRGCILVSKTIINFSGDLFVVDFKSEFTSTLASWKYSGVFSCAQSNTLSDYLEITTLNKKICS
jgi:hypothetical protein